MELISIIVPVYQVEDYLNRCVDSILGQTFTNLEIILVNDGSIDNSGNICDNYSKIDNRVKVIHKENGGLSSARNAGIEVANGEYYTFLDSDDWVDEKYIEKLYTLMKNYDADVSVVNYQKVYSNNDRLENLKDEEIFELTNLEALNSLTSNLYYILVTSWGKLYKKEIFSDLRFKVGKIHEDEFIAHHIYHKSNKTVVSNQKLLYYWQRLDSITGTGFKMKNKLHVVEAFRDRVSFLDNLGLYKARDNSMRSLFLNSREIYNRKNEIPEIYKDEFIKNFRGLKYELRNGKYSVPFKMSYELFYAFPNITGKIFDKYIENKKRIKKEKT